MKVSVFGLGYVGCVTAACLADLGHTVVGVDVNPVKVEAINEGHSPVVEPTLGELIAKARRQGRLSATLDAEEAVLASEISLICVGTPSEQNGQIKLDSIKRVTVDIGRGLMGLDRYHIIVVRSTLLPGVSEDLIIPSLECHSGKRVGRDFGFALNPEFLREGSAIADFLAPPHTLIGELDERSGEAVVSLYKDVDAPLLRTSIEVAGMVKYVSNAFHALKVTFANEIGRLCKMRGIDSREVMGVFIQDRRLNISAAYLKPGFAFGGSCLGKDLRALLHLGRHSDLRLPILESILPSNELHVQKALALIEQTHRKRIGLIGLSFKTGTDDLRESPSVELAERLIGKGYELKIFDPEITFGEIYGSNEEYIKQTIPHVSSLMTSSLKDLVDSEVVVIAKKLSNTHISELLTLLTSQHVLVDLAGDPMSLDLGTWSYEGICW